MSLRVRLVLAFVVAAVVPVSALGAWARSVVIARTEAEYERRLRSTVVSAKRRVDEQAADDRARIDRLCEHELVVDRLLLDLAGERFGPAQQDELVSLLPPLMRSLELDALELLDAREARAGRVLGAGQFPGRAGAVDRELLQAARLAQERAVYRPLKYRHEGRTLTSPALLYACEASESGAKVMVVGARFLGPELFGDLYGERSPVEIRFESKAHRAAPDSGARTRDIESFRDAEGVTHARLYAVVDDAPLAAQLRELDRGFLVAGTIALALALLLGAAIGLSVTRPLGELEHATERVAAGDFESMIGGGYGGEVGRALDAFDRMTKELRGTRERLLRAERIAAWRDIARRIAHEIKNPLSPIQVSIETMRKTYAKRHPDFDDIFEESTLTILEEVERLKHIVTEFSRFARLPRPRPEEVQVEDILQHVTSLYSGDDAEVTLEEAGALPKVRADREQLTQVFVNLVQNAVDATRARHGSRGGRVEIATTTIEGMAVIAVTDNGPGIPPEQRARVFEPYFTTKAGGTGLGLAIVHRIVEDHRGRVEVTENEHGGATFTVFLAREGPAREVEASTVETASAFHEAPSSERS